jgi:hypothetical protein
MRAINGLGVKKSVTSFILDIFYVNDTKKVSYISRVPSHPRLRLYVRPSKEPGKLRLRTPSKINDDKLETDVAYSYHRSQIRITSVSLLLFFLTIRSRVLEPYESVRTQTISLVRLQETCDLLRRIIRILQLGKKVIRK